ncbi:hypothetical protein HY637_04185 [Candidatus Woesearchaeota archaeon]|nr:hypothetical protein [Candidatus Woesearchaeota archaeon]
MEFVNKNTIKLDKEINELDKLVFRFIGILKKHTDYVVISGYVAILLGRSRTTEDVDIFIKEIDKGSFSRLYLELQKEGFWCLNSESESEIYGYLADGLAARFALEGATIPNFEVKVAKKPLDKESFVDRITAMTTVGDIFISSIERQIAFKRNYLKSEKDIEDAKHMEEMFKNHLDTQKINKYKGRLISRK